MCHIKANVLTLSHFDRFWILSFVRCQVLTHWRITSVTCLLNKKSQIYSQVQQGRSSNLVVLMKGEGTGSLYAFGSQFKGVLLGQVPIGLTQIWLGPVGTTQLGVPSRWLKSRQVFDGSSWVSCSEKELVPWCKPAEQSCKHIDFQEVLKCAVMLFAASHGRRRFPGRVKS